MRYNNNELAHRFNADPELVASSHNGNMYCQNRVIYSYGPHFPICRIESNGTAILTTVSDSVTTTKHVSSVRSAISNRVMIECYNIEAQTTAQHRCNLAIMFEKYKHAMGKASRARTMRGVRLADAECIKDNMQRYSAHFHIKLLKKQLNALDVGTSAEVLEQIKENERKAAAAAQRRDASKLRKWRRHEYNGPIRSGYYLRLSERGEAVETSHGARVSFWDAKALYSRFRSNSGRVLGRKIGGYTVTGVSASHITVGCHKIAIKEIDRLLS